MSRLRLTLVALSLALLFVAPGLAGTPHSAQAAAQTQAVAPTAAQLEALAGELVAPVAPAVSGIFRPHTRAASDNRHHRWRANSGVVANASCCSRRISSATCGGRSRSRVQAIVKS